MKKVIILCAVFISAATIVLLKVKARKRHLQSI